MRSFAADEDGGSVTEGGGISRGTVRPGIGRGSEDNIELCTSAMAVLAAQKETVLFRSLKKELLPPSLHEIRIRAWRTLV